MSLTLENVKTDAAQPIDVGVVDFGKEANLGRSHGIIVRQEELELKDTTCMLLAHGGP